MIDGISFKRHRFPRDVIRYAISRYLRFMLSVRDVEEMPAGRATSETVEEQHE